MHSITEFEANIPAFLAKLWNMVEDSSLDDLIAWGANGLSFVIKDQSKFAKELLPMYYKHNNMASFIRQLNMYGFHKNLSLESGCAKMEEVIIEFYHPCFQKNHPDLLQNIKRKINSARGSGAASNAATMGGQASAVNQVLHDVRKMKSRQDSVDSRLSQMKIENEALWREVAILRQKHMKQQQIVNKLIQFLVSFVQHPHANGISVKRRNIPLMLQDRSAHSNQLNKNNKQSLSGISEITGSPSGPVIHEIDPNEYAASLLLNDVRVDDGITSPPEDASLLVDNPISQESVIENAEALDTAAEVAQSVTDDADLETNELLDLPNQMLTTDDSIPSSHEGLSAATSEEGQGQIYTRPNQIRASKRRPRKPAATKKRPAAAENPVQADITGLVLDDFPLIIPGSQALQELTTVTQLPTSDDVSSSSPSTVNIDAFSSPIVNMAPDSPNLNESHIAIVTSPYSNDLEFTNPNTVIPTALIEAPTIVNSTVPIVTPQKAGKYRKIAPKIITSKQVQQPQMKVIIPPAKRKLPSQSKTMDGSKKSKSTVGKSRTVGGKTFGTKTGGGKMFGAKTDSGESFSAKTDGGKTVAPLLNVANLPSTTVTKQSSTENNDRTVACMLPSNSQQSMKYARAQDYNNSYYKPQEIDNHVDSMQNDLETLKELLKGESISLDANTLLGKLASSTLSHYLTMNKNDGFDFDNSTDLLFNAEDPFSLAMDLSTQAQTQDKSKEPDNKLVSYSTSNTQELGDLFDDYNDWILSPTANEPLNEEDVYNIPELNTPDILMTPEPQMQSSFSGKKKKK